MFLSLDFPPYITWFGCIKQLKIYTHKKSTKIQKIKKTMETCICNKKNGLTTQLGQKNLFFRPDIDYMV